MANRQQFPLTKQVLCDRHYQNSQPQVQKTAMRWAKWILGGIAATLAATTNAPQAQAVTLHTGDIVIADFGLTAPGVPPAISRLPGVYQIDPLTGVQTAISYGGNFIRPIALVFDNNGNILVGDITADAIFRVDPKTGNQTQIFHNPNFPGIPFAGLNGLVLDDRGNILVSDYAAAAILRVNPTTGDYTIISKGGFLKEPSQIALDDSGDILVADYGANAVFRIDPLTGAQTIISSGGQFTHPNGITVDAKGNILVADDGIKPGDSPTTPPDSPTIPAKLFQVDPKTGAQTLISSGGSILDLNGIDIDANGNIVVADFTRPNRNPSPVPKFGAIYRVDPNTGNQTLVSSNGFLRAPLDLKIYKSVPEPSLVLGLLILGTGGAMYQLRQKSKH